jgi:hypothetical protein
MPLPPSPRLQRDKARHAVGDDGYGGAGPNPAVAKKAIVPYNRMVTVPDS